MAGTSSSDADAEPVGHGGNGDDDDRRLLDALLQELPALFLSPSEEEVHDLSATAAWLSATAGWLSATAGTSSSAAVDAADPPEAVGHGGDGSDDDDDTEPLLDLIKRHPDLFEKEVLERLDPADRAFLRQVDSACRVGPGGYRPPRHREVKRGAYTMDTTPRPRAPARGTYHGARAKVWCLLLHAYTSLSAV
jgi:hypothetical protein